MVNILIEGFFLGLSTGISCTTTCTPYLFPWLMHSSARWRSFVLFILGRLLAYLLVGGIAGLIGKGLGINAGMTNLFSFIAGVILMASAIMHFIPNTSSKKCYAWRFEHLGVFALGFLLGLSPCIPFVSGVGRVLSLASAFSGLIFFLGFFMATILYILPLPIIMYWIKGPRAERIGLMLSFLVGLWFVITAVIGWQS